MKRATTTRDATLVGRMPILQMSCIVRHARWTRFQVKTDHYGFFLTSERRAFNISSEVSFVEVSCGFERAILRPSLVVAPLRRGD